MSIDSCVKGSNTCLYHTRHARSVYGIKESTEFDTPKWRNVCALLTALTMIEYVAAETSLLREDDTVGASFWIATAMMFAATAFFIMERGSVAPKWRTSMTVAALVTGVACAPLHIHARGMGADIRPRRRSEPPPPPLVLRYVDWLITVPLQVAEFYLILAAVGAATAMLFWRLFGASLIMLISGFLGEAGHAPEMPMLIIGCLAWFYIMYEVWAGDAKKGADTASEGTRVRIPRYGNHPDCRLGHLSNWILHGNRN